MKTNYEHYKEEIIEALLKAGGCEFVATHTNIITHNCNRVSMSECKECDERFIEWLNAEYKEPVTISKIEFTILNEVDDKWKYMARDDNGDLFLYEDRPEKMAYSWIDDKNGYYHCFHAFNELFKFVKWEDNEPYLIDDLLNSKKYEEVEENE